MQKGQLGKQNKLAKDARVRLSNPISLGAMNRELLSRNLATYIAYAEEREFLTDFPRLISNPKISSFLQSRSTDLDTFSQKPIFDTRAEGRSFDLFEGYLRSQALLLKDFVLLRRDFENLLLQGRFDVALDTLALIRDRTGESLWLMRSTLLTLGLAGRLEDMNEYCSRCKDRINDRFLSFVLNCFLLISTDPILHSRKIIATSIRELEEAGVKSWADMLTLLFVPVPIMQARQQLNCLDEIQNYPVVDQLVLLSSLFSHNSASEETGPAKTRARESKLLALINSFDHQSEDNEVVETIIQAYEFGDYQKVDELFYENLNHQPAIFPLIGLVAKARQIATLVSVGPDEGPIHEISESLCALYSLKTQPTQALERIKSLTIQLHHFKVAPFLQLTLYSALPHHFPVEDRRLASKKARLQSGKSSKWTNSLEGSENPILSYQYLSPSAALPEHRLLKQEVKSLAEIGTDADALLLKLKQYSEVSPLAKDYFELSSSSLIHTNNLEGLIKVCATALADEPNAYVAFPLARLVDEVTSKSMSTLDALMVVYFYVKDVARSREYLLNEIFEEFLLKSGVRRPSDLVTGSAVSSKLKILLRDVSTIETMDFLGTFDGSNDVRAERIKILDLLKDLGEIDPELHKEEVEEIVGLVIVDSAATEFSVHKIYVNDGAIRRKISDDIASLLLLYRSASEAKEEKFIRVNDDSARDVAKAVVAGDRNTTLLKILTVVRNSFLYDDTHGLDVNLSAEIRHGFFSNVMRSKLEDRHLLTETDEQGNYKQNEYWAEANGLLAPGVVDKVDGHLRWFSESYNQLLAEAEEWMKISTDVDNLTRAFNFSLYLDEFSPLIQKADSARSSDEIIDFCLALLWQQTETALSRIREKIDVELRQRVDQLFYQLNDRLNETRGSAALAELLGVVHQTRNDIREDISTVTEWFRRADSTSSAPLSVPDLIDTAIECYARVRHKALKVSIALCEETKVIVLDGIHMKAFVVALLNIFENSIKHSGFGMETKIKLTTFPTKSGWELIVSNPLTTERLQKLHNGGLEAARLRMANPAGSNVLRVEGGSGLGKVVSQLKSISDGFGVSIFVKDEEFQVRVCHE